MQTVYHCKLRLEIKQIILVSLLFTALLASVSLVIVTFDCTVWPDDCHIWLHCLCQLAWWLSRLTALFGLMTVTFDCIACVSWTGDCIACVSWPGDCHVWLHCQLAWWLSRWLHCLCQLVWWLSRWLHCLCQLVWWLSVWLHSWWQLQQHDAMLKAPWEHLTGGAHFTCLFSFARAHYWTTVFHSLVIKAVMVAWYLLVSHWQSFAHTHIRIHSHMHTHARMYTRMGALMHARTDKNTLQLMMSNSLHLFINCWIWILSKQRYKQTKNLVLFVC